MEVVRGAVPDWALNGYGYGYGSGYGYGDGSGSGYGSGYGSGSGYSYGSGYGDGSGSGYGDGKDKGAYASRQVAGSVLRRLGACAGGVEAFEAYFPQGAAWPADRERACVFGLDVSWADERL